MSDFEINDLDVLTGRLGISAIPGRDGRFRRDLDRILDWAPSKVLTMTTQGELDQVGAQTLGGELMGRGVDWHHLPVADFGTPGEDVRVLWPDVSARALMILGDGGRVLVHCFGGCGRSGMAVLRLMADAGEAPQTALLRLRAVRPCAVETDAQYAWASGPIPQ